jgi:hypothetical protein
VRQHAIFVDILIRRGGALCKQATSACENLGKTAMGWAFKAFPQRGLANREEQQTTGSPGSQPGSRRVGRPFSASLAIQRSGFQDLSKSQNAETTENIRREL